MEKIILKAEERAGAGKKSARDLRKKDIIPANVYKAGKGAVNIQVAEGDLEDVLHTRAGENVVITLKTGKAGDKTVVIKEIQRDPIHDRILHVDFNEISLTEALKVNVPLALRGEAEGVKKDGGVLEHIMWELQVECLPTAIPEKIEADVSALKIGDAIYVKNITVPAGVKVLNDPELIAVIIKAPHVEVPKEEVAAEAPTEPELIRKKKEEEPEAGAAETPKEAKEAPPAKESKKE